MLLVIAVLVIGTGWRFFRPLPDSHATWPVALALLALLFPLMAMHAQTEQTALVTPVPIHLVPLAFTWTALVVIAALVAIYVIVTTREQPRWAGVVVAPLAVAFGWLPLLVLRATEHEWFVATLMTFALAEVASGIAWFLPERARWFVTPLTLAAGAWTILRDQVPAEWHAARSPAPAARLRRDRPVHPARPRRTAHLLAADAPAQRRTCSDDERALSTPRGRHRVVQPRHVIRQFVPHAILPVPPHR